MPRRRKRPASTVEEDAYSRDVADRRRAFAADGASHGEVVARRDVAGATTIESLGRAFEDPHAMPVPPQQAGGEEPAMAMSSGIMPDGLR